MSNLYNFCAFQLAWFACVLGAAQGPSWAGVVAVAVLVAFHLRSAPWWRREVALLVFAALIGLSFDSLLAALDWIDYRGATPLPDMAPFWIVALWVAYATTLNVSLSWLKGRLPLAVALGAVGGPLAYLGGARLGALALTSEWAVPALAFGWAVLTPLLVVVAQHFDGFPRRQPFSRMHQHA
jgi:hypothetical protein